MRNAFKWAFYIYILSSCTHPGPTDDLNEVTEFSQKSEATVPTSAQLGKEDNEVERDENGNIIEPNVLTRENLRSLHMLLHRYAKKVTLEGKAQPAVLGYQHEELIQTLAGVSQDDRTSLMNSILSLVVVEKAVYSHLARQSPEFDTSTRYDQVREENEAEASSVTTEEGDIPNEMEDEVELFSDDQAEPQESLDVLVKDYDIDIPNTLRKNRLLAFPYIHSYMLISLQSMDTSEDLKFDIQDAIKDVATPWVDIYREIAPEEFQNLNAPVSQENKAIPTQKNAVKAPIPFFAGDFAEGEDQLTKAKSLASKHLYREAISVLKAIDEDSPYYSTKNEMIKKYSSQAVKSLRRKAAQSFQSAIPAPGLETKLGYLKEAESYLIDAIEDYPDANQIDKVRENLVVIQKRIEVIESQIEDDI